MQATITETSKNLGRCDEIDGRIRTLHNLTQTLAERGIRKAALVRTTGETVTVLCGYSDWTVLDSVPAKLQAAVLRRYGC